jgi:hypothetical protein
MSMFWYLRFADPKISESDPYTRFCERSRDVDYKMLLITVSMIWSVNKPEYHE